MTIENETPMSKIDTKENEKESGFSNVKKSTFQLLHWVIQEMEESSEQKQGTGIYHYIIETVEKILFEDIIARTEGNQLEASRILGINRNTLRYKIQKFGIQIKKP